MNRIFAWAGRLPIGNIIEWTLPISVLIVCLALMSGCATKPPEQTVELPLSRNDATATRALALQKIGESATDGETKRLAIFALLTMDRGETAPPVQPQVANRSLGDAVLTFLDRTSERLFGVAPAYLAYRGQIRQSQTTETVAAINRDVSLNQSNNFLALGKAGIDGTASLGTASVNALATVATRPSTPTTQVTVTGNLGPVNVGPGTQNNASNNPTSPTRICTTSGTPPTTICGP